MASSSRTFPRTRSVVLAAARRAASGLGWKIAEHQESGFKAGTPGSLVSWGEEVTVTVTGDRQRSVVKVESEASAQLVTWGKNDENVEAFLKRIATEIK